MHCPRCGQQQVSEDIKFCSRCGLPLGTIADVVLQGGYLSQLAALEQKKTIFNKKNGVLFSIFWAMFFLLFMTSLFGVMELEKLAGASAIIGIFGDLCGLSPRLSFCLARVAVCPPSLRLREILLTLYMAAAIVPHCPRSTVSRLLLIRLRPAHGVRPKPVNSPFPAV